MDGDADGMRMRGLEGMIGWINEDGVWIVRNGVNKLQKYFKNFFSTLLHMLSTRII